MTRHEDRDELLELLARASLLPSGDPMRRDAQLAAAEAGDWAGKAWLELLAENDLLRLELERVDIPDGLQDRLLRIPDEVDAQAQAAPTSRHSGRSRRWMLAAAVVVFCLGLGGVWEVDRHQALAASVEAVALLAIDDHVNDRDLEITTSDLSDFCQHTCPHHRQLPHLDHCGCKLLGGRSCTWENCPIVYSLWERDGELYSLARFPADELKLPDRMAYRIVCCPRPGINGQPTDIVVWTENGSGFALTGPHSAVRELANSGDLALVD